MLYIFLFAGTAYAQQLTTTTANGDTARFVKATQGLKLPFLKFSDGTLMSTAVSTPDSSVFVTVTRLSLYPLSSSLKQGAYLSDTTKFVLSSLLGSNAYTDSTYLNNRLALKLATSSVGSMAYADSTKFHGSLGLTTGAATFFLGASDTAATKAYARSQHSPAPAWGDLTGTLSAQTDLQNALDAKKATADSARGNPAAYRTQAQAKQDSTTFAAGSGYSTVDSVATALTKRSVLNFTQAGVATDTPGSTRTDVTIPPSFPLSPAAPNPAYDSKATLSISKNTYTSIYTCPAGKKAFIGSLRLYNSASATTAALDTVRWYHAGSNYVLGVTGAGSNASADVLNQNISFPILSSGDSLAIKSPLDSTSVWSSAVTFDSSFAVKTVFISSVVNGDNTLYTVPAGKSALIFNGVGQGGFDFAGTTRGTVVIANASGGTITYTVYIVPNGGTTGYSTKASASVTTTFSTNQETFSPILSSGTSIVVNANSNAAGQLLYVRVLEY